MSGLLGVGLAAPPPPRGHAETQEGQDAGGDHADRQPLRGGTLRFHAGNPSAEVVEPCHLNLHSATEVAGRVALPEGGREL